LVSQPYNPSLVDASVMPMKYSANTILVLRSDSSLDHVVSHPIQPVVVLMQYLVDTTSVFWGDVSLDHVVSHPIQPMVEEVFMSMKSLIDPALILESEKNKEVTFPMQSLINPTLILEGDASFDHVLSISSPVPSKKGIIPLSLSMIPPNPRMVSFGWNDLVEPRLPSYAPF
jgi:hypothetical protein